MLERESPLLAKDARNGAPGFGFHFLSNRLLDWLKTTTSVEVSHEGSNRAAIANLPAFYSIENTKLAGSITATLWHGSCFSLYCRIRVLRD
jgi:hypothetical protein